MIAFLILLLAALTRFVPHALHGVGMNFTAVGGGLLYFGARHPKAMGKWYPLAAVAVLALSDVLLTTKVYGYPFHASHYVITWMWWGAVTLLGSRLLKDATLLRGVAAVLASATGFFLISNGAVWAMQQAEYPHTLGGLMQCLAMGLPFYKNDLASTGIVVLALFGLPVVAAKLVEQMRGARQPLA